MTVWKWATFEELSLQELYDILSLRQEVFVIEQKSIYQDLDFKDQHCMHLMVMHENKLAAYLRVLPEGISYPGAVSIGRVVTAPFARKLGLGKQMMQEALQYCQEQYKNNPITISAQYYLEKFYKGFGFVSKGEPYDEDGILHIKMTKQ